MSTYDGLAFCSEFGNAFCICLLLCLLNVAMITVILHDLIIRYKRQKQINFFVAVSVLMLCSLISSIIFTFDSLSTFDLLAGFFFNIYFALIVYYVSMKVANIKRSSSYGMFFRWFLHIGFSIYILFLISGLIERQINYTACKKAWYVAVNGVSLILCIMLIFMCLYFTKSQQKKLIGINNPDHTKNPLPYVWRWIFANILCQVASLVQSIVYQFVPEKNCSFSSNQTLDQILKFLFVILSFNFGLMATILFFRQKYSSSETVENRERKQSVTIELTQQLEYS